MSKTTRWIILTVLLANVAFMFLLLWALTEVNVGSPTKILVLFIGLLTGNLFSAWKMILAIHHDDDDDDGELIHRPTKTAPSR